MSQSEIKEALNSPFKRVKDADREVEYLGTDELLKRQRILSNKKRPLMKQVTIRRERDL